MATHRKHNDLSPAARQCQCVPHATHLDLKVTKLNECEVR